MRLKKSVPEAEPLKSKYTVSQLMHCTMRHTVVYMQHTSAGTGTYATLPREALKMVKHFPKLGNNGI
jgi:hypothetical protein